MVKCLRFIRAMVFLFGLFLPAASIGADADTGFHSVAERESDYYVITTLPTPAGAQFEAGGLQFLGSGALACSTRTGDIWIGKGVSGEPSGVKWTLFESGLHEVL